VHGRDEKFVPNLSEERLEAREGFIQLVGRIEEHMNETGFCGVRQIHLA